MAGLKRYVIEGEIGRGAMGVVHKARPKRKKGKGFVALKEFSLSELVPEDRREEFIERFKREAAAAAAVEHPGVVKVIESFEEDGRLFLAMELVEAPTLAEVLKVGALPPDRAVPIILQILEVLGAAQAAGIVHRDLKPSNVFLLPDDTVKVADFGVARIEGEAPITRAGSALGTVGYMSPEQLKGEPVDARSDLFAAGVMLYEMLAGSALFGSDTPTTVMYRIVFEEPASLAEARPELPGYLGAIIAKATQKDPENRYSASAEMAQDLVSGTAPALPAAAKKPGVPFRERIAGLTGAARGLVGRVGKANLAVIVGVAVVIAAVAGFVVWRNAQTRAEEARALQAEAGRVAVLRVNALSLAAELDTVLLGIGSKGNASVAQRDGWDRAWSQRLAKHEQAKAGVDAFNARESQKQAASMVSYTDWWGYTTTWYTYTARVRTYPAAPAPPAKLKFDWAADSSRLADIQARAEALEKEVAAAGGAVRYLTVAVRRVSAIATAIKTQAASNIETLGRAVVDDAQRGRYASKSVLSSIATSQTVGPIAELEKEIDLELNVYGLPQSVLRLPPSSLAASGSAGASGSVAATTSK